jgi:hypothetical protein
MAKYRYKDIVETNPFGQTLGYVDWMGGVELTYVGDVLCADGCKRNWFKTGEPVNAYATPGYVHVKGKKVHGCIVGEYIKDFKLNSVGVDGEFIEGIRYKFHEWPKIEEARVIPLSMPNY